ncbi:hypothetical protein [Tenacibaculum sp. 190524A05c]|uniref:hypothetical protein n=1 Tax=Tenacibaculum platacis TaxID=3137852 RepID=UPI0031FB7375
MKNILLTSFLFIGICLNSQNMLNYLQGIENDTIIIWEKDNKISWDNFEGSKLVNKNMKAESAIGIMIQPFDIDELYYDYLVFSYFHKNKSTTKVLSKHLLNHEQMHFNIGEIYARKMRKVILKQRKINPDSIKVQEVHSNFFLEYSLFSKEYDKETKHSVIHKKQKEWDKKILNKLKELEAYSLNNYIDSLKQKLD